LMICSFIMNDVIFRKTDKIPDNFTGL